MPSLPVIYKAIMAIYQWLHSWGDFRIICYSAFKGNHKETLLKTQGLTLGILLPLQMSFFSYILFFIISLTPTHAPLQYFTALYPGWFYRNLSWYFCCCHCCCSFASRSVLWWLPRDSYCSGIPVPTDVWPADLKISFWNISFLLCAWSVTHSHPSHPPLQKLPDPTVNGWWVTVCGDAMTVRPPQPQRSAGGSNDSPSDSPRLQMYQACPKSKSAQVSIYWPLEEPATTWMCTLDQNTSWSQKRGWSIWLPKRSAHLVPATQYLGIQPRRICDFFLSSLIIFPCPTMPGLGLGFLGTFHAWFILRVPRRKGDSSPCGVTEDTTTSSLLIQTPSRQGACSASHYVPNTCVLIFKLGSEQWSFDPESVLWFSSPLAPSFFKKIKTQSCTAFYEFKGNRNHATVYAYSYL